MFFMMNLKQQVWQALKLLSSGIMRESLFYAAARWIAGRNLPEVWSVYRTPYLALPMRLTTEYLYVYCRDKVWHIDLEYVLELEGQTRSRFKLKMEIEEDVKREYEGSTGCCH